MAQKFDNVSDKELFVGQPYAEAQKGAGKQFGADYEKASNEEKSMLDDLATRFGVKKEKAPKEKKGNFYDDYEVSKEDLSNTYRGAKGVTFIDKGNANDPELEYKGKTYNYWDIENALWEDFKDYAKENNIEVNEQWGANKNLTSPETDEAFNKYVKENVYKYLEDGDDYATDEQISEALADYQYLITDKDTAGTYAEAVAKNLGTSKQRVLDMIISENPEKINENSKMSVVAGLEPKEDDLSELDEDLHDDYYALKEATGLDLDGAKTGYQDNVIETDDGDYIILTEEEAYETARDNIENDIDDMGLEAFTENFQDWIIDNALDQDWFQEAYEESNYYYIDDIENEAGNGFESRLIEEAYDEGLVSDDELEENEYGDKVLKDNSSANFERIKEDYLEYLNGREDDYVGWYRDNFGDDDLTRLIRDGYVSLDIDKIVDECIKWDGIAHFLNTYDGEEIELPNGKFAYRIN